MIDVAPLSLGRFPASACCCTSHRFGGDGGDSANLHRFKRGGTTVQCSKVALPAPTDFRLLRELGSGSLGTNYKALTLGGGRVVSLKVIKKERLRRNALDRRVVTGEQQVLSKLRHPYVARFYCSLQTRDHLLLATEYLPDHTLHSLIKKVYQ